MEQGSGRGVERILYVLAEVRNARAVASGTARPMRCTDLTVIWSVSNLKDVSTASRS